MQARELRYEIIRPALKIVDLWSLSAENLLTGTALVETGLMRVTQLGDGPALSFYQIEPTTYDDVLKYLYRKRDLKRRVLSACFLDIMPSSQCLTWNLRLATLIARLVYWRVPTPLPAHNDIEGLAKYWKKHYNTEKGRGTVEDFCNSWSEVYESA